jgi:hypothetical protein
MKLERIEKIMERNLVEKISEVANSVQGKANYNQVEDIVLESKSELI